jgi:hypothetical protein
MTAQAAEAYPLSWPAGRPRTKFPKASRFGKSSWINGEFRNTLTTGRARDLVVSELNALGAKHVVISTNIPLRNDGMFRAAANEPADSGVAVYFTLRGRQMVFACDQWETVKENAWAIAKTIEALRGIERWGSGDMLERAFTGFAALPGAVSRTWRDVLEVSFEATFAEVRKRYLTLSKERHPDYGGDEKQMAELNAAYEQAEREMLA